MHKTCANLRPATPILEQTRPLCEVPDGGWQALSLPFGHSPGYRLRFGVLPGTDQACCKSSNCFRVAMSSFIFTSTWSNTILAYFYMEICMGKYGHSTAKANAFTPVIQANASSHYDYSDSHTCPMCGACDLIRIRRRPIDRIMSMFVRLRRYRCTHSGCQWKGNIRERKN